ncbi:Interferon-induced very large GTPase 1 [Holothuria leucospilota]|uniref:Interferon-induced very large GTPase 1 n=1 Tax=Holothuria leucospilota TaxID=206669 RepID=A0A9Q1HKD4_HOLLE|nr:Interferon-induced very large GTPase 1 [Holothuria leucospilota]
MRDFVHVELTAAGTTVDDIQNFQEEIKIEDGSKTSRGFGLFLVELATMLTLNTIKSLATVFNFQPGEIDQIERNHSASYEFIKSLREKGIISPQDISDLIGSLRDIKLHGVAENVTESYNKNVNKGTLQPQGFTSDKEDKSVQQDQPSPLGIETELPADPQVISTNENDVENRTMLQSESEENPPSSSGRVEQTVPFLDMSDEEISATGISKETEREHSLKESASNGLAKVDCPAKMSEQCKEFLLRLGLEKGLHGKYSIRDSQGVKYGLLGVSGECSIFEEFISRITSYDYRVHLVKDPLSTRDHDNIESDSVCTKESDDEDWFDDLKAEKSCSDTIVSSSARDVLFAILNCLDPFLLQEIVMKLSACQLAVPLLMPDWRGNVTLNLWGLRKVSKSWFDSFNNVIQTESVISHPFPAVSALRIGEISISKSNILNKLLGPAQSNDEHAYFLSHEQDPQLAYWSKGTLECVWFLPNLDFDPSKIPTAFSLLNLRGNSCHYQPQVQFATMNSFATIVFCDFKNINVTNKETINKLKLQSHVILVISKEKQTRQKPQYKSSITVIHTNGYTALEVSKLILDALVRLFKRKECVKTFCIENSGSICGKLNIVVDEAKKTYKEAKKAAKDIYDLLCQNSPNINKSEIFVLQQHWKQWSELDKNKKWVFETEGIEHEIEKIKSKKNSLRELQCEEIPSAIMRKFLENCSMPTESRLFFIRYLEYYLNVMSNTTFKPLLRDLHLQSTERRKVSSIIKQETTLKGRCETNEKITFSKDIQTLKSKEEEITYKERDCIKKIDENSFGIEYFVREIAQITECYFYTGKDMKQYSFDIKQFPSFAADLLLNGYPIEIMDGDANHVPLRWVQEVLKTLSNRCGKDAKVYVISVLGIQSSGKSTLLNSMFGVQFAVRAGRCTKGAFMQLVPVHVTLERQIGCNFIVIIDTEGLGAPEKFLPMYFEHDNELATFALCNSDLTLINIGGQTMGEEMTNVLQIAAHAFIRMKEVNLKVECRVVQQFVADVTAEERNEAAMENIMIKLDNAIATAAKEEGKDHLYSQFSDVFAVQNYENDSNNVQCIPSLWRGFMAVPDHHYSTRVLQLKQSIIRSIQKEENKLSIKDFSQRFTDVWNAIKKENFVFNFQNTKEITLYEELMKLYRAWISPVRIKVMERELGARQYIENSKTDRIHDIYKDSVKTIKQLLQDECERVKENITSCLNNQKFKEIKRYAMSFYSDLSTFKTQLISNATMEISQFVELCVKIRKKEEEEQQLFTSMHEKVELLASDIRKQINEQIIQHRTTKSDHDNFTTTKFEEFWAKWTQKTDKRYLVKTLSQISEDIASRVKNIIIQETQNEPFATFVLHYLENESLDKYSISSSYITKPSDILTANVSFSTDNKTAGTAFNKLLEKINKYAENGDKFSESAVKLLQDITTFIKECDVSLDIKTVICYFYSVFILLLEGKNVGKQTFSVLENADSLSVISKEETLLPEHEIEETLQRLISSDPRYYRDIATKDLGKEAAQKRPKYCAYIDPGEGEIEVFTDKGTDFLPNDLSTKGQTMENWTLTAWAQQLEEIVDSAIGSTERKLKSHLITAKALSYFCDLIVKHCYASVPSNHLHEALKLLCDLALQKCKESRKRILKRFNDPEIHTMKLAEPLNYSSIQSKIKFILSVIDDAKVENSEVIKKELIEDMVPKYGCVTSSFPLFQHLDRRFIRILPTRGQAILRSVYENVINIKKTFLAEGVYKAPFNAVAVNKVFSDMINSRNSDIFTNEVLGSALVHIGAWLTPLCAVAQHEFERSKNPAVMLRKKKNLFFSQFKSLCSEKYDEMIAKTFVYQIVQTAKGSLKYKIYLELVTVYLVQNAMFKIKRSFIGTVLVDICERDSYQDIVAFLVDFDSFSHQWILQYIVKSCNKKDDSLLKTIIHKCIEDMKNAALYSVQKADELLDNTNTGLSEWLNTFSKSMSNKKLVACEETEIEKLGKYLKVSNMKVFSSECRKLLQDLDEVLKEAIKVPTPGNLKQTQQWLLSELPKDIQREIFETFKGCTEQCPFCFAVCEETLHGHPKHVVNLHIPKGIHGRYWDKTEKLVIEMCTSSVESTLKYKTPPSVKKPDFRHYKEYTVDYENWYIQGIRDDRPLDYWKYIFATFNDKFAERHAITKMSGPRLTIRNIATKHLLYVGSSWEATTSSADKTGEQAGLFKVQWCEQISDKIAKTVLIRTDFHPQSLLDVRDLYYQGRALETQKCYDHNRWWKLIWLEIAEGGVTTVLFQSYTRGTYLAEKEGSAGVEVIQLSDNIKLKDIPDRAKWNLTIGGRAFRPGQEDVVCLSVPVATVRSAFTDGDASCGTSGPMAAAFAASGATTLAEAIGTASAIAAGAVLHGISPAAATLLHGILKDVSHAFFMDW